MNAIIKHVKNWMLMFLYKKLILSVRVTDKPKLWNYEQLSVYGGLDVPTNKGDVSFLFKADRRRQRGIEDDSAVTLCNYFVETQLPAGYRGSNKGLVDKVIVVTMIRLKNPNIHVMAWLLLREYVREMVVNK